LQLGGKGANLCEMARTGLNVPPGLTITTEVCQEFYKCGQKLPDGLMEELKASVHLIEAAMNQEFCSPTNPLLLSVRSGAAVRSLPAAACSRPGCLPLRLLLPSAASATHFLFNTARAAQRHSSSAD
jgi:hypothetical protein